MSKVFGLAGCRIGILIAPPDVVEVINRIRKPFNINSLAQVAAVAAIEDLEYLEKLKRVTWDGLDYFLCRAQQNGSRVLPVAR